jgi:predicted DsbA family dithiol-disulfide isomerase
MLSGAGGLDAIKEADELARRFRVEGVPFFIVNGTATFSGAQPAEAFLELFKQVG